MLGWYLRKPLAFQMDRRPGNAPVFTEGEHWQDREAPLSAGERIQAGLMYILSCLTGWAFLWLTIILLVG